METKLLDVERYLLEVLSQRVKLVSWKGQKRLPFFLVNSYLFYEIVLLSKTYLLMVAKKGAETTPAVIRKHWEQVIKISGEQCIFVQEVISAYNRKRLIEHRVPFIIPGNQLYLPELGIDLKEHLYQLRAPKKVLSPATQAALIFYLLNKTQEPLSVSELARKIGYTKMTMTRAFDELENENIGSIFRKGRERFWQFHGSKHELWELVQSKLRSPVKKRIWLRNKKPRIMAGLSALAQLTMLNPPSLPIYAISLEKWKIWKESGVQELPDPEKAICELEVWYYSPELFAERNIVDPFSLYLSLEANKDERIEKALDELWRLVRW